MPSLFALSIIHCFICWFKWHLNAFLSFKFKCGLFHDSFVGSLFGIIATDRSNGCLARMAAVIANVGRHLTLQWATLICSRAASVIAFLF